MPCIFSTTTRNQQVKVEGDTKSVQVPMYPCVCNSLEIRPAWRDSPYRITECGKVPAHCSRQNPTPRAHRRIGLGAAALQATKPRLGFVGNLHCGDVRWRRHKTWATLLSVCSDSSTRASWQPTTRGRCGVFPTADYPTAPGS